MMYKTVIIIIKLGKNIWKNRIEKLVVSNNEK